MTQVPRVSFTVWDVDEASPLPPEVSTIRVHAVTVAVGLTRGADPGEGAGVTVWSFAPRTSDEYPGWLKHHAAMAFVAPYAAALGVSQHEASDRVNVAMREGEPTTLTVDGAPVTAAVYRLHGDWRVTASTEPGVPLAVASSGREHPASFRAT
ncbi:hypothetical protein [Micromonospora sp. WMMD980]|uniref:hypothetical protein n=1 Tax=Micromonospora sp. WMMD980 TaxID=3016088 RepID=UPI0024173D26|nr:hypothetical protein [Micromonospora sp. WMMD980]MDG4801699.1 hypothetical protein [Micromonospora sp. WMMD980]